MLEDNLSACDMDCRHPLQIEESRLAEICNSQKRSQNFLQKKEKEKKFALWIVHKVPWYRGTEYIINA